MNEMRKTKAVWTKMELEILVGKGIDIGAGGDPVVPGCRGFDIEDGDANDITKYINGDIDHKTYDYVFSSHCLEHMRDPHSALFGWWSLVKPGGHLFIIVPDEDLYEQGYWPSRFNTDHKWTFTISKKRSWCPNSINLLSICTDYCKYKGAELVDLSIMDNGYDRQLVGVDQTRGNALAQIQMILKKRPG